jgi:peroxiredoxin
VQPELTELGIEVVAISADQPSGLRDSLRKQDLGYALYSDRSLAAARAFGIAFQLSDAELKRYRRFGIDLEQASGETHHQLPVPSVFLVEAGGRIAWVYSNPDYKIRPANAELLEAAQSIGRVADR